ncbi:MAG: hypothetical protein LUO91_06465 [Methanomicrobiales archaeon]|nr:hypothetical protein [Methanomicrobiales archaeon]
MKRVPFLFLVVVFTLSLISAGSALKAVSLNVTPAGDVQAGDQVTARGTFDLGTSTFDEDNYLEFYSQLDRSTIRWEYAIGIDGRYPPPTTARGSFLRIDGWTLSYPDDMRITVQVSLDGKVPSSAAGNLAVFRARHLDEDDEVVGTEVLREKAVINPAVVAAQIAAVEENLAALSASIDQKASAGVDVGDAEALAASAEDALSRARDAPLGEVSGYLATATAAIDDAGIALDRAWSQHTIDQAQETIDRVDRIRTELAATLGAGDTRLSPVTFKRDHAATILSYARDEHAAGTYASARARAADAQNMADEAWDLGMNLKTGLTAPVTGTVTTPAPSLSSPPTLPSEETELEALRKQVQALEEENRRLREEQGILHQIIRMVQDFFRFLLPSRNH